MLFESNPQPYIIIFLSVPLSISPSAAVKLSIAETCCSLMLLPPFSTSLSYCNSFPHLPLDPYGTKDRTPKF
ncbi:hypothetical protein EV426DRAFT_618283, partial [Tirmania nivea]